MSQETTGAKTTPLLTMAEKSASGIIWLTMSPTIQTLAPQRLTNDQIIKSFGEVSVQFRRAIGRDGAARTTSVATKRAKKTGGGSGLLRRRM